MTSLDSILKSRDITLPTKIHLVKVMVFPVIVYGCESWTIKKAERRRTDAFELWCCKRLLRVPLRVPWTARISNQSILKQVSPGCSLEGLMLKLKFQYFGHLMWRVDSFDRRWHWERLRAEGEGDDRRWDGWMVSPTQWTWLWVDSGSWWWTGRPGMLWFMGSQRVGHDWVTERNWIECSTFTASSFRIWNSSTGIPSPPLALFVVMLPKAHLTSHSRMSCSRRVITPSWLSRSGRSFLSSSSVYSCHLFLISSASVRSITFLSFIEPVFAWNVSLLSLIFLKRSLVFPILLFSSISLHWSLRKAF